jgi:hypothetical protein
MIQARDPGREDWPLGQKPSSSDANSTASLVLTRQDTFGRGGVAAHNASWVWLPGGSSESLPKSSAPSTRCANIYIADNFSVVVASEAASIWGHGALSLALREHLCENPHLAAGVDLKTLPEYQVAAFIDGPNILIRIEDSQAYFEKLANASQQGEGVDTARDALFQQVGRYRRAIDVALKATEEKGGEVLLLAGGFSSEDQQARLKIAKILGEVHRVHEEHVSTRSKFVAANLTETRWGRYYYRKEQGTRYISVEHLAALGKHIPTNRAIFVEGIETVSEWLRTRNKQGAREGVLLLIDKSGSSLLKNSVVERPLKEQLGAIAMLAQITPKEEWEAKVPEISKLFGEAIATFQAATHKDFRRDDPLNPRYVEVVANILRGRADNLPLGAGFSTPLKAVDVGRFVRGANGSKHFHMTTGDPVQREIVNWLLREDSPIGERADWLCLCEPEIALTPDYHPARVARSLLPQDERNFIVFMGVAGEEERRFVIRQNPYSASHWDSIDSERLDSVKSLFSSVQLADASLEAIGMQYELINALYGSLEQGIKESSREASPLPSGESLAVPTFAPIQVSPERRRGDFFLRPLIDGERLDLINRFEMSPEQMQYGLDWIGKLMVVHFLAQRPAFSLHELLSVSEPKGGGYIRSIGVSESFCNAMNVTDVGEMLEKEAILYGTHLATWIMSLRFGAYGDSLATTNDSDLRLIASCLHSFEWAYSQIIRQSPTTFVPIANQVTLAARTPAALLKELPELDVARNIPRTLQLLNLPTSERAAFLQSIQANALEMCDRMARMCAEPSNGSALDAEEACRLRNQRAQLIDRIYSLVGNHLSGDSFYSARGVLSGSVIDFGYYSLEERAWLLTVIDVELWLTAVHDDVESHPLWCFASESGTDKDFLDIVRKGFWHACLSEKRAKDFYEAVHGLEREFAHDMQRRAILNRDLMRACNFEPPWDNSAVTP